jgi:hypothetical protein
LDLKNNFLVNKIGYHINKESGLNQPTSNKNHKLLTDIRNIVFKDTTEPISYHYDYKKGKQEKKDKLQISKYLDFKDQQYMKIWGCNAPENTFQIKEFFSFFFKTMKIVLKYDYDLINIVGELIICTEELTQPIMNEIKSSGLLSRGLFKALAGFQKQCLISDKYFDKIMSKFGGWAFFQLTTRKDLTISSSRKFVIDEYIGFINKYASTALIIFCLEYMDKQFISRDNFKDIYRSFIYSLDFYINENFQKIKDKLDNLLLESVNFLMNPQDL